MSKVLIKGNHAIAEAAIRAGCMCYFGYPITPQSEIGEYLSIKMPEIGRVFVQAESELAAVNMLSGAGATGVKAMTSSSSCAVALKQECISAMAASEIPGVIVSVMRAGPGLGNITPSQADYIQATRGGGNGDYKVIVLAPSTLQEHVDLTYRAFYLAQKYRSPVILLSDGMLAQMMEPVVFEDYPYPEINTDNWAVSGAKNRDPRWIGSLNITDNGLEIKVNKLFLKYDVIAKNETFFDSYMTEDADLIVAAFGSTARIVKSAVKKARENHLKVGLFRPITLVPFPEMALNELAGNTKGVLTVEMNMGQMLYDVKLAVNGKCPVQFYGRTGGSVPTVEEIYEKIEKTLNLLNNGSLINSV